MNDQNLLYKIPTNKNFGYTFTIIFFLISLYFLTINYKLNFFVIFISISIIFLFITLYKSNYLYALNYAWFKFGIFLSRIINPIILGSLFIVIFTPVALWFKIIKRDALNTKFNDNPTYWNKKIKYKSSMKNQF